jgi:glutamate-1-semialdehyde 2,1-aminomutase
VGKIAERALWERACRVLPGGVSSPVRSFRSVGGEPFFSTRGDGAYLEDQQGRRYIDYVLSWGPLILGHAHPAVVEAVQRAARSGLTFGTPAETEVELAELIVAIMPALERVRFVSSGTEATMSAVRLARGVTGRERILKFDGCYHGHYDSFLVKAGSGVATLGLPDSPGVPRALSALTTSVPFNDLDAVEAAFDCYPGEIAAVILEPVMGNVGLIEPETAYLSGLRDLTRKHGSLLIFDEVMTGFRVSLGGAQERYGVEPDLTTLGKVVGGGLPVAAFGGKREIMEQVAPSGPVYQAGTLSGNPLGMAAGLAQLRVLQAERPYDDLERLTGELVAGVLGAAASRGTPACGAHVGSMWGVYFTEGPVRDYAAAKHTDTEFFSAYHGECLRRGVFFAPSAFEAGFLSTAHGADEIERTLAAVGDAMDAARVR